MEEYLRKRVHYTSVSECVCGERTWKEHGIKYVLKEARHERV